MYVLFKVQGADGVVTCLEVAKKYYSRPVDVHQIHTEEGEATFPFSVECCNSTVPQPPFLVIHYYSLYLVFCAPLLCVSFVRDALTDVSGGMYADCSEFVVWSQ